MHKTIAKICAALFYFYNEDKRKEFYVRYNSATAYSAKLRKRGVLGANSYIAKGSRVINKHTRIGKFCSIARNVSIGTTGHSTAFLTTSPVPYMDISHLTAGMVIPERDRISFDTQKPVFIGNDVWIGLNVVVMDGVSIGDGAVIGAGAVVTKDIPPYAIAVGVPAKVIKYRFSEDIIHRLLKTRWYDQPDEVIKKLPFDNIEKCLEILEGLRKA